MAKAKRLERPGQVGGKRDENRKQRRAELEGAALEMFLAQGIEGTTIDDIVERSGAAKGSFYRYYEDKRDIVSALLAPVRTALETTFATAENEISAAQDPQSLVDAYLKLALSVSGALFEHRDVALLYLQEARAQGIGARKPMRELSDAIADAALRLTLAARHRGLLRDLDPRVTSLAVLGATERLLFETFRDPGFATPLEVAEALVSMVLDGLRPSSRPEF